MSGGDAYLKIRAGASLVELYTGLVRCPAFSQPACFPTTSKPLIDIPASESKWPWLF